MRGYMWKNGPKAEDNDSKKKKIKRFLFSNEGYKRRYFVLDNVKLELKYYSDFSKTSELGCIDLLTVVSVRFEPDAEEELPTKFPLKLVTEYREWSMCCENQEDYNSWKREINAFMKRREEGSNSDATFSKESRQDLSLTDAPMNTFPANTFQRVVMDETDFKSKGSAEIKSNPTLGRKSSGKKPKPSFFKRRSNLQNTSSFLHEMLQLQRARLGEESVYNSYTGNVGIAATASLSRYISIDSLEFFQEFISSCDGSLDISVRRRIVSRFLDDCQFEFYTEEGEVLINEGSKYEWVYFLLEGEIEQRKNWSSTPHRMDEKILPGQSAGVVEVLHFNGLSTTTLLVSPGAICLKMSVTYFLKQFQQNSSNKGIFSSAMDSTCDLYLERLRGFVYKRLLNLPLLESQPISNIQELSHIFSTACFSSGDNIINVGDKTNDFFIIMQGSCSVFQKSSLDEDEVDEIVRSCRGGDWVGEAGLINIHSRHVTVTAFSDVVALRTDASGFRRFLDIVGPRVRELVTQSTRTYLKSTLETIPLFANIDESHIEDICREVVIKELDRDTLLYDSGDKIAEFCVILHGHVKCSISFVSGLDLSESPPFIDTMREFDFFGEGSVLYESLPSRLQYFTPPDVKVVVLSLEAKKLKPFLSQCPLLHLRLEERLQSRKTHLDLIDTLVDSISTSLSKRHSPRNSGSSRSRSKQSLGHMADMKAKESFSMTEEVNYLREEVKRLNGVQYADVIKSRTQKRAVSTFKSTLKKIKSSLPGAVSKQQQHAASPSKVPSKKKGPEKSRREAEFAVIGSPISRQEYESKPSEQLYENSDYGDVNSVRLESLSDAFLDFSVSSDLKEHVLSGSDSSDGDDDSTTGDCSSTSTDVSVEQVYLQAQSLSAQQMAAVEELSKPDPEDTHRPLIKTSRNNCTSSVAKEKEFEQPVTKSSLHSSKADQSSLQRSTQFLSSSSPTHKDIPLVKSINNVESAETYVVDAMYARMLKMKLPESAIRKKMTTDGVPPDAIDKFFRDNVGL